jgi:UDP-N-acetylglucosamine:LPS N-acetylglucosamine transferase
MTTRQAVLILTASMGAGHDGVAAELARRLVAEGVDAEVVDVLDLLPMRLGPALRRWYGWMMRTAPWLYAVIYRIFFISDLTPTASPLTVLAAARVRGLVRRRPPAAVASTFHLAAQATGHLRERGRLPVPSAVVVTDFAVHRQWLHPGNDLYLCTHQAVARGVTAATGRPASCHAPLVRREFLEARTRTVAVRAEVPGVRPGDRLVLVVAGSWGVGRVEETARVLAASGRYVPVVLCGRNEHLRRRLRKAGVAVAFGWREDMPELMAAAYALVDNAAGLTCKEAFAAGLPVVCFLPIPGHGRDGARAMARAGLCAHARSAAELLSALDRLGGAPERARQVARAAALFASPSAAALLRRSLP